MVISRHVYFLFLTCLVSMACLQFAFAEDQPLYTLKQLDDRPELHDQITKLIDAKYAGIENEEDLPRAQALLLDILTALRALGYYDVYVERVKPEQRPYTYSVYPGKIYTVSDIALTGNGQVETLPEKITIAEGQPIIAQDILIAKGDLYDAESKQGCAYSLDVTEGVQLNRKRKSGDVRFDVERGQEATFGALTYQNKGTVKQSYLSRLVRYEEGGCWKRAKLESLQNKLLKSGLFSSASIEIPDEPDENGSVPVTINLKERAHRSISLGASYYTDEGPGVSAGWTHRNLFGSAEKLSVDLTVSALLQELSTSFAKPFVLGRKNTFRADASIAHEDTDAYEETNFQIGGYIDRAFSSTSKGSTGLALELTEIKDEDETRTFGLVSVPTSFSQDKRDDVLNPHKGYQWSASATPFFDALGEASPFTKMRLTGSTYFDLSDGRFDPVIALRASVGSIVGSSRSNVPRSKRFFAGGGGSIRGFGYQEAGPEDDSGDPIGGRSLFEASGEFRFKVTDSIGMVAFVDAGNVYETNYPDLSEDLYVGAGLGLRYYTGFGPVRFDVGVPVTERGNADAFQIYISLGQAF